MKIVVFDMDETLGYFVERLRKKIYSFKTGRFQ